MLFGRTGIIMNKKISKWTELTNKVGTKGFWSYTRNIMPQAQCNLSTNNYKFSLTGGLFLVVQTGYCLPDEETGICCSGMGGCPGLLTTASGTLGFDVFDGVSTTDMVPILAVVLSRFDQCDISKLLLIKSRFCRIEDQSSLLLFWQSIFHCELHTSTCSPVSNWRADR